MLFVIGERKDRRFLAWVLRLAEGDEPEVEFVVELDSYTIRTSHAEARLATDSGESGRSAARRWCLAVRVVIGLCRPFRAWISFLRRDPERCPGLA